MSFRRKDRGASAPDPARSTPDPAQRILPEGVQPEGIIVEWEPSPSYRTKPRVTIGLMSEDGSSFEFMEELSSMACPRVRLRAPRPDSVGR